MIQIIVLLLIVVPALEIGLLIGIGNVIGGWTTVGLLVLTGVAGAWLARKEATKVWHYARYEFEAGQPPGQYVLDGICIFAGGLLLLAPGFITDIVGFLLVVPFTRLMFRNWILQAIRRWIEKGNITIFRRW